MHPCKSIDLNAWERKEHYLFFKGFEHPHFDLTAPLEVTRAVMHCRETKSSFFKLVLYLAMRTANAIPEFRTRIKGNEAVEYVAVDAAPTYMPKTRPGLYTNMLIAYDSDYREFSARVDAAMAGQDRQPTLSGAGERLDVIYLSCIPWVAYTSLTNPVFAVNADSVPRVSWGKYAMQDGMLKMPVTVQLHHGLADAYHAGLFYTQLQDRLNAPEKYIS